MCFVAWSWVMLRYVEAIIHPQNIRRLRINPKRLKRIKR